MSLDAPGQLSIDASSFSVGIIAARYNAELVDALLDQVVAQIKSAGVSDTQIEVERVPGSGELPVAAALLADTGNYDVIVTLGVLIRGDTIHYELIADAVTQALQSVALESRIPVINGVVVAENYQQAESRCRGKINRGAEFARAAIEMAALKERLT
ncbi:MAG TPA: 6,7-dimethyl-8-ribityllumazine synthase [Opitutaceae bacterium]|nr:6,7-dimethyl-8-ribityllumazine synthase [Opitutaceae bacterium]